MKERPQPERMDRFFDTRSEGYEAHMRQTVASFAGFYQSIAAPIPETNEALRILVIGCGTGLELDTILNKASNAIITGIDVSSRMLRKLGEKFDARSEQLHLIHGSYLDVPLGESVHDYAVAVMTLHHLVPTRKLELYRRLRRALKPDGAYIEGDWVVSPEEEKGYLHEYREQVRMLPTSQEGAHHIDVPLSLETEKRLLIEAGFSVVDVVWQADGNSVYVARG